LGYTFGSPLNGWDPNKKPKPDNSLKDNAKHIKEALRGIRGNLGRGEDLRSFLANNLEADRYKSLTDALDDYVSGLKDGEWLREQIGNNLSEDIIDLLNSMGYTTQ